ncbi:MAG: hypothetical protein ACI9WU_002777 [Myxococcota bacterium]|jgi:hypothetical protein
MDGRRIVVAASFTLAACAANPTTDVGDRVVEPGFVDTPTVDDAVSLILKRSNYRPSERAISATPPDVPSGSSLYQTIRAPLEAHGEIIVLEGGQSTVTSFGNDEYGLVMNQSVRNPMEIVKEVYTQYADDFDEIVVFTTFPDGGSEGSVAWYMPIRNNIQGIGIEQMDTGYWWGSQNGGQLSGFINMQYVGKYGTGMANADHPIHPVMAQEFAHRWGAFLRYVDGNGQVSDKLLGRDQAHWANIVQTNGSVHDGSEWVQTTDNTFWLKAKNARFSHLDQYAMGLRAADEVDDFFLINNATYQGQGIDPAWPLPNGITVKGTREEVSIDQIVAAHGPRIPSAANSPADFRVAVVLVTRPNEDAATVAEFVQRLEGFRNTFEQLASTMSDGRMRLCTQISAPCDAAGVTLQNVQISEREGNGDGILDPGEVIAIDLSVTSTGFGAAPDVVVALLQPADGAISIITPELLLGDIPEGATVSVVEPALIKIPPTLECGAQVVIPIELRTDGRTFPAEIPFDVGIDQVVRDGFDKPDQWKLDPYGTDSVSSGGWEIADPKGVDALYVGVDLVTQPSQDHSPDGINALVTGADAGQIGDHDVDGGTTTALGPVYDLSGVADPILTWWTWHFAYDFNNPQGVVPVDNDALLTEASVDGGTTWIELDADRTNTQEWMRKEVRLRDVVELTGQLQLRFTITDDDVQSLTEAMVDDILIWQESVVCNPDGAVPPEGGTDGGTDGVDEVDPDDIAPIADPRAPASAGTPGVGGTTVLTASGGEPSGCVASGHGSDDTVFVLMLGLLALLVARRSAPVPVRKRIQRPQDRR